MQCFICLDALHAVSVAVPKMALAFVPLAIPRSETMSSGTVVHATIPASELDALELVTGMCYDDFVDCWTISLVDIEQISADRFDNESIDGMEAVKGKYWKIG